MPTEGPFRYQYASRSPERILCLNSVRLVLIFLSLTVFLQLDFVIAEMSFPLDFISFISAFATYVCTSPFIRHADGLPFTITHFDCRLCTSIVNNMIS